MGLGRAPRVTALALVPPLLSSPPSPTSRFNIAMRWRSSPRRAVSCGVGRWRSGDENLSRRFWPGGIAAVAGSGGGRMRPGRASTLPAPVPARPRRVGGTSDHGPPSLSVPLSKNSEWSRRLRCGGRGAAAAATGAGQASTAAADGGPRNRGGVARCGGGSGNPGGGPEGRRGGGPAARASSRGSRGGGVIARGRRGRLGKSERRASAGAPPPRSQPARDAAAAPSGGRCSHGFVMGATVKGAVRRGLTTAAAAAPALPVPMARA